ncbi:hypothetical protein LMH87_001183 [Akanthomyces muscarius]|uniref:Uncharacterized protein n=1 Tax=Akanthomyces muscarius TaxID=2231603 RepID=A0A9W8QIV5_AKAMU|nr:hypothetical protein LMH87_001183 [Akanthomyces muscarius]KAJ4155963.1 hypothetical protein LMH87_001183 [Akanthomyces muscarius]
MKLTSTLAVLGAGISAVFANNVTTSVYHAISSTLPTGTPFSSLIPHNATAPAEKSSCAHRYPRGPSSAHPGYPVSNSTSIASDYLTGSGSVASHISSSSSGSSSGGGTAPISTMVRSSFSASSAIPTGTSSSSSFTGGHSQPTTFITSSRKPTSVSSSQSYLTPTPLI